MTSLELIHMMTREGANSNLKTEMINSSVYEVMVGDTLGDFKGEREEMRLIVEH